MRIEELIKLLARGEDQEIEFKRKVSSDLGEEIVAFANANGGIILVGVDDDGNILGCNAEEAKKTVSSFLNSIVPPVTVKFDKVSINDKEILVIKVDKSNTITTLGGVIYIRIGNSKRPISLSEILSLGAEYSLISVDSIPTNIHSNKISKEIWRWFIKRRMERGFREVKGLKRKMMITKEINGQEYLTLAGLLFFYKEPQEILPHTYIRIVRGSLWSRIGGPVWKQVEISVRKVYEMIPKFSLITGVKRIDMPWLSLEILREAIVNALVHRNYAIHSEVFIEIKNNEVIIRNPGSFPPGVTPENPQPIPRNPILYELMFQTGYVERQGGGIEMMRERCRELGILMEYKLSPNYTVLTFKLPYEKLLTDIERKIFSLLSSIDNASSIAKEVGLSKPTVIKILKKLESIGLVKRTGKGPSTRWVITK